MKALRNLVYRLGFRPKYPSMFFSPTLHIRYEMQGYDWSRILPSGRDLEKVTHLAINAKNEPEFIAVAKQAAVKHFNNSTVLSDEGWVTIEDVHVISSISVRDRWDVLMGFNKLYLRDLRYQVRSDAVEGIIIDSWDKSEHNA